MKHPNYMCKQITEKRMIIYIRGYKRIDPRKPKTARDKLHARCQELWDMLHFHLSIVTSCNFKEQKKSLQEEMKTLKSTHSTEEC